MSKLKINNGLAAVILLASLFAGWQTLLLVVILMLIFGELDDKVKNLMVGVLTFFAGITLVSVAWTLISAGINLVFKAIESVIAILNSYLSLDHQISLLGFQAKFVSPIKTILSFMDSGIDYLILFTKFAFIISTLTGRTMKENPFNKKVSEFVQKVLNFNNSFEQQNAPQNFQANTNVVNNNVAMNNNMNNNTQVNNNQDNLI